MTIQDTSVLDLGHFAAPARPGPRKRPLIGAGVLAAFAIAAATLPSGALDGRAVLRALGWPGGAAQVSLDLRSDGFRQVDAMTVDDKGQIIANGTDAQSRNAEIPMSDLPLEQAHAFMLRTETPAAFPAALQCLTQAVYYEAAVEPMQGRRAVAQVVLNRMRHPAYPKSVCGVVYQGSERRTGCQFSFTCDGSLLRRPATRPWQEAEAIARAALAGFVERSVGTATHYHADYVLPKWAFQLGKIDQIGRHIFYRFNGGWGRASALNGRYSGLERIPALDMNALQERLLAAGEVAAADNLVPGLTVTPHVTDRHASSDIGGRLDTTKQWRLAIPDPVQASSRYREAIGENVEAAQLAVDAAAPLALVAKPGAAEQQ